MSRYFPRKEPMERSLPFRSCMTRSGTVLPTHESPDEDCAGCCWLPFSISAKNAFPGNRVFKLFSELSISDGGRLLDAHPRARTPRVALFVVRIKFFR